MYKLWFWRDFYVVSDDDDVDGDDDDDINDDDDDDDDDDERDPTPQWVANQGLEMPPPLVHH